MSPGVVPLGLITLTVGLLGLSKGAFVLSEVKNKGILTERGFPPSDLDNDCYLALGPPCGQHSEHMGPSQPALDTYLLALCCVSSH